MPVKPRPEPYGSDENPGAPEESGSHDHAGIPEPERRTHRIPPWTVYPAGVVGGDVDDIGIGGFDDNVLLLHYYLLLVC
jgi:hypothetical protein